MVNDDSGLSVPPALLFCPADDENKIRRLPDRGAAAVVLDLEDAVAPARREGARQLLSDIGATTATAVRTYIRVNAPGSDDMGLDIEVALRLPIAGILLPKVEDPQQVHALDAAITGSTAPGGAPRILPMIETATGLINVRDIARSAPGRIETLVLGTADLTTDLGLTLSPDERELAPYRAEIVVAARAAGLPGPVDGPELNLGATDFTETCERSARAGFSGRVCLTPGQASEAERAYTEVAPAELHRLLEVVEVFEAMQTDGLAVARIDGVFVDPPVYLQARRALHRHFAFAKHHTDTKGH
jgi:citrate lyase subunit beta/citryl-CoA lyase